MNHEFIINEELGKLINNVVKKFPSDKKRSAVIESLLILQHHNSGYVTKNIIKALSDYLLISEIDIYEVATFYTMINIDPVGRNVISVCNNVSCMLRGSDEILSYIEDKLKIKVGESTEDNKFYLKDEIECLAACNGGPMMQVNHKNYENLTLEKVDEILENVNDK
ncbi:MAG: NADH-quinone oxidoreductase subunit E [Gammaproteobacteria bacterium]|jgi:NADH-quinone oxidoreductase subunit E|tara:strand:+ start:5281 stop:5778 length:498 start_codon:yes stop_codon:yes gene_type:complete